MKKLMSVLVVLSFIAFAGVAQESAEKQVEPKRGKHKGMLSEIPDLTDEQKAQIKEIRQAGKAENQKLRDKLYSIREKTNELKSAENPDLEAINSLIDEGTKVKAEMLKNRTASEVEMVKILTPEQRKAYEKVRNERKAKHEKKRAERKQMHENK